MMTNRVARLAVMVAAVLVLSAVWWSIGVAQEEAVRAGSPEWIRLLFDRNALVAMFVWGLLTKYAPWLAPLANGTINYVNVIGYVLTRLIGGAIVPDAHAGVSAQTGGMLLDMGGIMLGGFTNAVWARQLYEGFGRPLLEGLFGWRKAGAR